MKHKSLWEKIGCFLEKTADFIASNIEPLVERLIEKLIDLFLDVLIRWIFGDIAAPEKGR